MLDRYSPLFCVSHRHPAAEILRRFTVSENVEDLRMNEALTWLNRSVLVVIWLEIACWIKKSGQGECSPVIGNGTRLKSVKI